MKKWNWEIFCVILLISFIGALGNKSCKTILDCFITALIIGVPAGLLFAWITKED